MISEDIGVIAR